MTQIPAFSQRKELFEWLIANKTLLINEKKASIKQADGISFVYTPEFARDAATKADQVIGSDASRLFVRSIINTTKLMDSHEDVHINGLWKKSLNESKDNYLIQEHDFCFEGVISDEVEAYTKIMTWKSLGYDWEGSTEALVYDSILHKDRNPYMFEQYAKRRVKNHSVGMRYVKMFMCVDSPMYAEEKENWDKYIDEVVNREQAEAKGYFWAVTEAKNVEGSAVLKGSNFVTPTMRVTEDKHEPPHGTHKNEPLIRTQKLEALNELLTKFKQ